MDRIEIPVGDITLTFKVEINHDGGMLPPWEEHDGHGVVSDWTSRDKHPGEWVLDTDRSGNKLYYNFQASIALAKQDGRGVRDEVKKAFRLRTGREMTAKEVTAEAVTLDFKHLQGWCAGHWQFVVITVTLLDQHGDETGIFESLGGVEDLDGHDREMALEMAQGIADGMGETWGVVYHETYGMLPKRMA